MPGLGNLSHSSSLSLSPCPNLKLLSVDSADSIDAFDSPKLKTLPVNCKWDQRLVPKRVNCNGSGIRVLKKVKKGSNGKALQDYLRDWVHRKMESGLPKSCYFLPFLVGAKRLVECLDCHKLIYPGEEVLCSVRGCQGVYHKTCAEESFRMSNPKKFQCPQHVCFVCRQRLQWRCVCCTMASHDKCSPWPDAVIHLKDKPGRAICWRHPTNWRLDKKHADPATEIQEIFCQLPLPYMDEEFKLDLTWRDLIENKLVPPPYVHIKRNVYLVKKKRDDVVDDIGCTSCSSTCSEDCVCRVQCISCSKACRCPESCTNRPFSKEKKIRIVKTELCGWGVEAAEPIKKGDFVIEYIGEVIDDAQCEKRLWDMKHKGVKNFYMCEIRKDFTIDATFKGNTSRFLNHSCDPNCVLEKWQVEGETRVGVFAARSIKVGEPLTYDYRFVQFGPEVRCHCGASNCQGYLGTKRKIVKLDLCWGSKRRRTSTACLAIITV
ncbi:hypothetical protein ERO13_D13G210900v2 [Gossypium hirsutum]|uniref:Histone-lysine N-methyltransferase ASHR3 n=4 Tax=Gossypium TaxID=3633 RepID=A0A1U8MF91_GOSHI|nr:histone-lysine N-methyltransferase ASHR3 [Gossypium hirsutum]KAB1996586.1 hypothetical protein ES319_D13G241300v1 [Gossypium barbadense]KAG4113244.1 hypothetical protein ERO13_D13G210900v2 [Gossypium hirsutum]TYG38829.1 hypothetical protein ES288_D13G254700v1 [Gossypium darwinii]TYI48431.1 hypothetical protein E1A91_D13G247500v1 [Gossypium mustelinum]